MLNPIKYLEFRAKMEPEKLALRDLSRSSNYGQLFLLVRKIAKKLEVAGIKPGDLVLTRLPSILDWVFINALFHEACVSCSGHPDDPIDPRLQVDWVISLVPLANFAEDKVLVVDRAWLQDVENGEPSSLKTFASEDDLCRLIFTGGTTGGAKAVPYSLRLLAERLPTTNPLVG
jgi:acyl-CoA synthetase (AMP-forming)/AMP-acid ligase II